VEVPGGFFHQAGAAGSSLPGETPMQQSECGQHTSTQERPVLFEAVCAVWRQKTFIAAGLAVIMALALGAVSLMPKSQPAKGFYQLSRQVKDFAPEAAYRENKIVNLQAVLPDQAREAKGQEPGGMQNVQGVTIYQPNERRVANLRWDEAGSEFFVTFDAFGLFTRSLANPAVIERFATRSGKKSVDPKFLAAVTAAVKAVKPVYAYNDERKIPNQSYREAVNYVMGVEISATGSSADTAVSAAAEAGGFLRDRLMYTCLNVYFDGEYRRLSAKSFELENQIMDAGRKIASLDQERGELGRFAAKLPQAPKADGLQSVAVGDGKMSVGGLSAKAMAVETALLDARQKALSLEHERKVAGVALGVFEPLKFFSDKTDSGEELYATWQKAAGEFVAKAGADPASVEVKNRLGVAGRNFDYYFNDVLGYHGTLAAEPPASRTGILAAVFVAGFVVMLVAAGLRESFAAYLRAREAGQA
jgi:hypothetical protein